MMKSLFLVFACYLTGCGNCDEGSHRCENLGGPTVELCENGSWTFIDRCYTCTEKDDYVACFGLRNVCYLPWPKHYEECSSECDECI